MKDVGIESYANAILPTYGEYGRITALSNDYDTWTSRILLWKFTECRRYDFDIFGLVSRDR